MKEAVYQLAASLNFEFLRKWPGKFTWIETRNKKRCRYLLLTRINLRIAGFSKWFFPGNLGIIVLRQIFQQQTEINGPDGSLWQVTLYYRRATCWVMKRRTKNNVTAVHSSQTIKILKFPYLLKHSRSEFSQLYFEIIWKDDFLMFSGDTIFFLDFHFVLQHWLRFRTAN